MALAGQTRNVSLDILHLTILISMSFNEDDRILEAFDILYDASEEAFRHAFQYQRAKALLIFGKLQLLAVDGYTVDGTPSENVSGLSSIPLGHNLSVGSVRSKPSSATLASSSRHLDSSPPLQNSIGASSPDVDATLPPFDGGHAVPSPSNHENSSDSSAIAKLIEALNDAEDQIKGFLSKSKFEAMKDRLGRENGDPCLVDLKMCNKPSHQDTFRKGLCQRSLGLEYEQWELRTHHSSKISGLIQRSTMLHKDGLMQAYLKSTDYPFEYHSAIGKGLEHGIKMLAFERMFGRKAISGILSFKYNRFRQVRLEDLAALKARMIESAWLTKLADEKTDWLDGCQNEYDGT